VEHIEEIFRVREIAARLDGIVAGADMVPHGDDDGDPGNDLDRHVVDVIEVRARLRAGETLIARIEHAQARHRRLQHLHGMARRRQVFHHLPDVVFYPAVGAQLLVEGNELLPCGQATIEKKHGRLFEGAVLGQLLDRVAAVGKDTLLAVDTGDVRAGRGDALKAWQIFVHPILRAQTQGCVI
jgi:hypothetical protein